MHQSRKASTPSSILFYSILFYSILFRKTRLLNFLYHYQKCQHAIFTLTLQFIIFRYQTKIFRAANLSVLLLINLNYLIYNILVIFVNFSNSCNACFMVTLFQPPWFEHLSCYNGRKCNDFNDSENITP